jgi:hypothetical protein
MAQKKLSKSEADRIMQVVAAGAHCYRKLRFVGKRLSKKQQGRLKACMLALVGPGKK